MEPVRITMQNFLSYRGESVDFKPITVACLVGENGAGKSSLLDALTWALFGQGTKGGAKELDNYITRGETEGRVELEFRLNGNTYRVVRGRSIARNKSTLEFFVLDGSNWRSLSGKTIADTQAAIEDTLRMDYRTFTASSLILQGKADSFTADMTDQERKEALARILGLDLWDRMQERAKELLRGIKDELRALEMARERLEAEIASEAELKARKETLAGELGEKTRQIESLTQVVTELEARVRQKPVLERVAADLLTAIRRATERARKNEDDRAELVRQIEAAEQLIHQCQQILSRRDEIEDAVKLEAEMAQDVAKFDEEARAYMKASSDVQLLERQAAEWDRIHAAEKARLEAQAKSSADQSAVLDMVPCGEEHKAACPLLKLARKASENLADARAKLARLESETNPYVGSLKKARADLEAIGYDPDAHEAARRALEDVRRTARLKPDLDAAATRVQELRTRQEEARAQIKRLEAECEQIWQEIREAESKHNQLQDELRALAPVAEELSRKQAELSWLRRDEASLRTELGRIAAVRESIERAKSDLQALNEKTKSLRDDLTTYELLEQACGKKAGVPALIVENAVPEIERLANDMLGKMAGGRLSVRLDTQAEAKTTGTMQEVLRITVLDGGTERPYQTYSGAERFMVDLALRVALSKFLTHRAGAEIKLFVLDEGLGCADASNRNAILNAIMTIAEEFSKVLVVTHLDELKDAFPQRVEVQKTPEGSRVRVVA
ncbi:MAG: SMC family ATPase [Firmicutes bacterium]|nr:SMC family ATPase [Bacillota bacterium]